MSDSIVAKDFTEDYIDKVFYIWYRNDRRSGKSFINSLPEENGRRPALGTLKDWIGSRGWVERADALDAEVSMKLDNEIIQERVEMFRQHREIGKELRQKGMTYLNEKGIESDNAAIRAIDLGLATERTSVGMAAVLDKISKMSDEQLNKELAKLLGKKEEAINADWVEDDE